MDDLTYEVRLGNPPAPMASADLPFAKYDPQHPVRMVIRARPKWFPTGWWLKLLVVGY